jgi:UDP-N-acetylmuramate dehydrogenase
MIINMGNATASDVLQLISVIKSEIRDRFSIQLEEEIQLVGF